MSPLSPLIGGIFRFLRRLPRVTFDQIPELVTEMDRRLELQREAFAFASWSVLKSEGVDVLGIPPVPEVGSELDSVLRLVGLDPYPLRPLGQELLDAGLD